MKHSTDCRSSSKTLDGGKLRRARILFVFGIFSAFGVRPLPAIASHAAERSIAVVSGTYGQNCGARRGNATLELINKCNTRTTCGYVLDQRILADTAEHCSKNFIAEWRCGGSESHSAMLSAPARQGDTLVLTCSQPAGAGK